MPGLLQWSKYGTLEDDLAMLSNINAWNATLVVLVEPSFAVLNCIGYWTMSIYIIIRVFGWELNLCWVCLYRETTPYILK